MTFDGVWRWVGKDVLVSVQGCVVPTRESDVMTRKGEVLWWQVGRFKLVFLNDGVSVPTLDRFFADFEQVVPNNNLRLRLTAFEKAPRECGLPTLFVRYGVIYAMKFYRVDVGGRLVGIW